jgi:hypothetical protein
LAAACWAPVKPGNDVGAGVAAAAPSAPGVAVPAVETLTDEVAGAVPEVVALRLGAWRLIATGGVRGRPCDAMLGITALASACRLTVLPLVSPPLVDSTGTAAPRRTWQSERSRFDRRTSQSPLWP